jgi:nicotinamidase-related amidase
MKTLIVIDMQPYFETVDKETTHEVVKLIKRAKRYKWPIILVKYDLGGEEGEEIVEEIWEAATATDNWILVEKCDNDGSEEIIDIADQSNISLAKCVVCGVNTDACVEATVEGLSKGLPDSVIEVVASACNTWDDCSAIHVDSMEERYANVRAA